MINLFNESFATQHIFKVFKQTVGARLREIDIAPNIELERYIEPLTNDLIVQLQDYFLANERSETTEEGPFTEQVIFSEEYEVPATWWDHFKMTYFPKMKRNMSRQTYVKVVNFNTTYIKTVTETRVCPHVHLTDEQKHLAYLAFTVYEKTPEKRAKNV